MKRAFASSLIVALSLCGAQALQAQDNATQYFISKSDQMLRIYVGGQLSQSLRVSTGKTGHETPSGIFSIIQKRKFHQSNIYSDAPMPFMQRLTWSGIALHEGRVPNYPASHGCIRLPAEWAQLLYKSTKNGTSVIITEDRVTPNLISHPLLPGGKAHAAIAELPSAPSHLAPHQHIVAIDPITTQSTSRLSPSNPSKTKALGPLKLLITWRDTSDKIRWGQKQLNSLGFDAGKEDGRMGEQTKHSLEAFKRWKNLPKSGDLTNDAILSHLGASGFAGPLSSAVLRVRQDQQDITEFDVAISDSSRELGTHFLQAINVGDQQHSSRWIAATLPNHLGSTTRKRLGLQPAGSHEPQSTETVLQRLHLPKDARDFLQANVLHRK